MSGVQIYITDYDKVELLPLQFYFMQVYNELYPDKKIFDLADSSRIKMFDKVMGTDKIRKIFAEHYKFDEVRNLLNKNVQEFKELSKKYYLYN